MAVRDLYSKRQKRLRGEMPDVYTYGSIPTPLRHQIIHIWNEMIPHTGGASVFAFDRIEKELSKEYGLPGLPRRTRPTSLIRGPSSKDIVEEFFLDCRDVEKCLDVVEIVFSSAGGAIDRERAVDELNQRLKEHAVGYEFRDGQIIRIDSLLIHTQVVQPALRFLQESFLAGANKEFLSAHEHYRRKRYKECLNDCLKAFESTMKAICDKRKWDYPAGATAKPLIEACIKHGLFPSFLESHLTGLRTTLESGVPTVRNKLSGHGQGSTPVAVPEEVASYALHLTATNILLLVSSESRMK